MDNNVAASAFVGSVSGALLGAALLQLFGSHFSSLSGVSAVPVGDSSSSSSSSSSSASASASSSGKSCFPESVEFLEGAQGRGALPPNSEVICLFDTETTIPNDYMIEFGAVLIHAKTFTPLAR